MTDILTLAHDCAVIIVTACAPIIAYKLLSLVGLQADANAVQVVGNALERGANMALDHAVTVGDPLMVKAETRFNAFRVANDYVVNAASSEAAKLGVAEVALATKLKAVLAGKLHVSAMLAAVPPPATPTPQPLYGLYPGTPAAPAPADVPVAVVGQPAA